LIEAVEVSAFVIPTETQESDGTHEWNKTTLLVSEVLSGDTKGFGYSFASTAAARLSKEHLAEVVVGLDPRDPLRCRDAMWRSVRNVGSGGIAATAMAALDTAIWDLKAKLLGVSLLTLLGSVRSTVPVYGSGGFTSQEEATLCEQLGAWVDAGILRVKMKVGREVEKDVDRVQAVRTRIGSRAELFVDANGAYDVKQALRLARAYAELGVVWFEEPVSSDNLDGLRFIRDHAPHEMAIAAGEYGYDRVDFHRMLAANCVDVLQIDATRAGVSGFLEAATLARSRDVPISAHTAPALHAHLACAVPGMLHVEYFHDHVRIERSLLRGVPALMEGELIPDRNSPGLGLSLEWEAANPYRVKGF
jgi:L-alanine-DL-glutamate epimerase-like enolase superfamily enzyme